MKIDVHTHILPESWPDLREKYGCDGWVNIERCDECTARLWKGEEMFRQIGASSWDPQTRLEECDKTGVTTQVLSTVPVMFSYWAKGEHAHDLSRFLNDHIGEIVRAHPNRFAGLGTLPMQAPELAVQELERCVKELGLCGVEIGTHIEGDMGTGRAHDWNLDEPALFPVFEAAAELGAAVFIHPWDMMGMANMRKYWLPWLVGMPAETSRAICSMIFGGVFERLPNLRALFAHGGGSFPCTFARIEHGCAVRPDLCSINSRKSPREALGHFWVDALVHAEENLLAVMRLLGEDKVAMGSDYPFPLGEHHPGALIEGCNGLTERQKRMLLAENALDFLGGSAAHLREQAEAKRA